MLRVWKNRGGWGGVGLFEGKRKLKEDNWEERNWTLGIGMFDLIFSRMQVFGGRGEVLIAVKGEMKMRIRWKC